MEHLDNPEAIVLMKLLLKFPEEISDAADRVAGKLSHRESEVVRLIAKGMTNKEIKP